MKFSRERSEKQTLAHVTQVGTSYCHKWSTLKHLFFRSLEETEKFWELIVPLIKFSRTSRELTFMTITKLSSKTPPTNLLLPLTEVFSQRILLRGFQKLFHVQVPFDLTFPSTASVQDDVVNLHGTGSSSTTASPAKPYWLFVFVQVGPLRTFGCEQTLLLGIAKLMNLLPILFAWRWPLNLINRFYSPRDGFFVLRPNSTQLARSLLNYELHTA